MGYSQRNAGFPGRNAAFPGLSDGGTQRQSSGQPAAAPGTGSGQFPWSGVVPPQLEEIAMRENGFVLALWGGIGIAIGALLPFIYNVQVDGTPFATGSMISAGDRFISLLFGLLLAGLALWTRYRPAFRRRIAIASLVVSLLGFAGCFLFTLAGVAGITMQTDAGPTQMSSVPEHRRAALHRQVRGLRDRRDRHAPHPAPGAERNPLTPGPTTSDQAGRLQSLAGRQSHPAPPGTLAMARREGPGTASRSAIHREEQPKADRCSFRAEYRHYGPALQLYRADQHLTPSRLSSP